MNYRRSLQITFLLTTITSFCACNAKTLSDTSQQDTEDVQVITLPGAYQTDRYVPILSNKKVGLVVNHTSMIDQTHLVDSLLTLGINVQLIFAPEHGFKGTAYNGEEVSDGLYKNEIAIRSLYGKDRKPSEEDLSRLDIIIFDIQDVGARFYTYISTLHYVLEAAAEQDVQVMILDRPNPNGHYVDGPIMEEEYKSFVGMHPVPIVYGMTIGEYGQMINGEGWLQNGRKCNLLVIKVEGYKHNTPYDLPIPPSPNLPNYRSILLYPSLCLLEGTVMSEGRGTDMQFQVYGHPDLPKDQFSYTPRSMTSSKYPKHEGVLCGGVSLLGIHPKEIFNEKAINLQYLIDSYKQVGDDDDQSFFNKNGWINKLAGTSNLQSQIEQGLSEDEIKASWADGLRSFRQVRQKYLLYPN